MAPPRFLLLGGVAGAGLLTIAAVRALVPVEPTIETVTHIHSTASRVELCPWRNPQTDLARFFPHNDGFTTDIVSLSSHLLLLKQKLGPAYRMMSAVLHVYRVHLGRQVVGVVLVRRAAAQFGALEVVAALNRNGIILGVEIQRLREPPVTARAITAPAWLASFKGKTVKSPLKLGVDIPEVPAVAALSAAAVVEAVKDLVTEYAVGDLQHDSELHQ